MPSKSQVLEFIQSSDTPAGKREIARAFGLKGQEKITLKRLLKDMAEEGLIDGKKTAYHRMGGVPKVTVLRVIEIEDGEPVAVPDNWSSEAPDKPPRLTMKEFKARGGKRAPALKRGDRVLSRTEETEAGWVAYPMKKLPASPRSVILAELRTRLS
ncbi:MAG: ribonuclease R, partial [Pseudomonadota bacterium]